MRDEELRRLAQDRDIYKAEVTTSRRTSNIDMKYYLEEQLQNLQNNYELKKRECEKLRMDLREYERIIEEERKKNFMLTDRLEVSARMEPQTPIHKFAERTLSDPGLLRNPISGKLRRLDRLDKLLGDPLLSLRHRAEP